MTTSNERLSARIAASLAASVDPAITELASWLAAEAGACAVLFYGSNLRTGSLDGVLDYYVLLPGTEEARIWPTVSYHEREFDGDRGETLLRAKVATMRLDTFTRAAKGEFTDTLQWMSLWHYHRPIPPVTGHHHEVMEEIQPFCGDRKVHLARRRQFRNLLG